MNLFYYRYGLSLNSETSTYGKMKCVPEGTSVGMYNKYYLLDCALDSLQALFPAKIIIEIRNVQIV